MSETLNDENVFRISKGRRAPQAPPRPGGSRRAAARRARGPPAAPRSSRQDALEPGLWRGNAGIAIAMSRSLFTNFVSVGLSCIEKDFATTTTKKTTTNVFALLDIFQINALVHRSKHI